VYKKKEIKPSNIKTQNAAKVVTILDLYSVCTWFETRLWHRLRLLRIFMVSLSGQQLEINHIYFLPNSLHGAGYKINLTSL
jgi:hypothetical protein